MAFRSIQVARRRSSSGLSLTFSWPSRSSSDQPAPQRPVHPARRRDLNLVPAAEARHEGLGGVFGIGPVGPEIAIAPAERTIRPRETLVRRRRSGRCRRRSSRRRGTRRSACRAPAAPSGRRRTARRPAAPARSSTAGRPQGHERLADRRRHPRLVAARRTTPVRPAARRSATASSGRRSRRRPGPGRRSASWPARGIGPSRPPRPARCPRIARPFSSPARPIGGVFAQGVVLGKICTMRSCLIEPRGTSPKPWYTSATIISPIGGPLGRKLAGDHRRRGPRDQRAGIRAADLRIAVDQLAVAERVEQVDPQRRRIVRPAARRPAASGCRPPGSTSPTAARATRSTP